MVPRFVIITPVYITDNNNRLSKFLNCIESVQNQTYNNFVHIIVNDGSSKKGVLNVFRQFSIKYKDKILIYHSKNQGVIGAISLLLNKTNDILEQNDFVLRLNSDDLFPTDALEKIANHIKDDTDVVCGSTIMFYNSWDRLELIAPKLKQTKYQLWRHLVEHKPFPHLNLC